MIFSSKMIWFWFNFEPHHFRFQLLIILFFNFNFPFFSNLSLDLSWHPFWGWRQHECADAYCDFDWSWWTCLSTWECLCQGLKGPLFRRPRHGKRWSFSSSSSFEPKLLLLSVEKRPYVQEDWPRKHQGKGYWHCARKGNSGSCSRFFFFLFLFLLLSSSFVLKSFPFSLFLHKKTSCQEGRRIWPRLKAHWWSQVKQQQSRLFFFCFLFFCFLCFFLCRETTKTSNEKRENGETGKRADQATHMMVNKLKMKK